LCGKNQALISDVALAVAHATITVRSVLVRLLPLSFVARHILYQVFETAVVGGGQKPGNRLPWSMRRSRHDVPGSLESALAAAASVRRDPSNE
jgi:hypothetical protein